MIRCVRINEKLGDIFHISKDRCYCDCLSSDDKNLYCTSRSFNFGNSLRSYILAARTVHWIIIIVISANFSRECRISYYPRGVTYPHPLFFISQRYKRNALLISRLLAIPPTRFFLLFSFSRDQYRMIRTKYFVNSGRPFSIRVSCFHSVYRETILFMVLISQ